MTTKLSQPTVTLATLQFEVDQRLADFITLNDDNRNKFHNFMLKVPHMLHVTFQKNMGPYVWCSFPDPHGRFVLNHEIARDRIAEFQKKFLE